MKRSHILFALVFFALVMIVPILYMYQTEQFNIWLTIISVCGFFATGFMTLLYMISYIERADYQSMYGIKRD